MTVTVINVELFGKVVAGERNGPRGRVNTDYFRRFVDALHESPVFLLGEFGGTTGSWLVVDDLIEQLSFEPFEPVEPLRGPSTGTLMCSTLLMNRSVAICDGRCRVEFASLSS